MLNMIAGYSLLIAGTAILWLPVCLFGLLNRKWSIALGDNLIRYWAKLFVRACGITREVSGIENIDISRSYVICTNHSSHMDGPVLLASLPLRFAFVIKKSLAMIPFWGWAIWAIGYVPIIRHDPKDSKRGMSIAAWKVRGGRNMLVFPEGTRSLTGEMLPFKKGAAVLAIEAQSPVLPVSISGTRKILPKKSLKLRPGHVKIVVGNPIETVGMTYDNRDRLNEMIRKEIEKNLQH